MLLKLRNWIVERLGAIIWWKEHTYYFPKTRLSQIKCDEPLILHRIKEWFEFTGWELNDFPIALHWVGLNWVVSLENFDISDNSFACVTQAGHRYKVRLTVGDPIEQPWEIEVDGLDGKETAIYYLLCKTKERQRPEIRFDRSERINN